MYAAVIEPLPALLGPFAILLLSIAILSAHFAAVLGTALPKNRRSARHSFSLLRKMEFRRASRTPAHSRFCPKRRHEPLMLMFAMVSYFFTAQRVFEANEFSWRPLIEVAWIFLGIFGTMIPVLDYVEFHASDFHLASDARFYWGAPVCSPVCSIMRLPILPFLPPPSVSIISTLIVFQMSQNLRRVTEAASPPFRWRQLFSAASPTSGTVRIC
jgi:hypothetical protein